MLKVRYFRIKIDQDALLIFSGRLATSSDFAISVVERSENSLVLRYTLNRLLPTFRILEDGTEFKQQIPITDQSLVRIFSKQPHQYLSVIDAPRGVKMVTNVLESISGQKSYFWEPLEITKEIIDRHIGQFTSSRIVSARVRDFQVTPTAIGRLEITSKEGLPVGIAPFLENKFYKIDSLTYEVMAGFHRGLLTYFSNGTLRASEPIVQDAFPSFEREL